MLQLVQSLPWNSQPTIDREWKETVANDMLDKLNEAKLVKLISLCFSCLRCLLLICANDIIVLMTSF